MFDKSKEYLEQKIPEGGRVLLALSGGPDSTCLFHLLSFWGISFEVAHVNHGWREESVLEEKRVRDWCRQKGVECHVLRLEQVPSEDTANLEDYARRRRYAFFREVSEKRGLLAVLTAHHQDDQLETVVKRLFEGARIEKLAGIQKEASLWGLLVWRPLLFYPKSAILAFLKQGDHPFFTDKTNEDSRFLRGRLRAKVLPSLEREFGKKITPNLLYLSEQMDEVGQYFQKKAEKLFALMERGPLGYYLPLDVPVERLEFKNLVYFIAQREGLAPSRKEVELIVSLWQRRLVGKKGKLGSWSVSVEKEYIFFFCPHFTWKVEEKSFLEKEERGWKKLWRGSLKIYLPPGECSFALPVLGESLPKGKNLKKLFYEKKVPSIFRSSIPIIRKQGVLYSELLTEEKGAEQRKERANHLLTIIPKTR